MEECWALDANEFMRAGVFKEGEFRPLRWLWRLTSGTQQFSICYEVDATNLACPWFRVSYRLSTGETLDYKINLDTTDPNYGGRRFWFLCPLVVGGRACWRRVGKLYLPSNHRYFGCRHCHDLTYTSCQRSDKRVSRLRRNPDALFAIIQSPAPNPSQLALAFKALGWDYDKISMTYEAFPEHRSIQVTSHSLKPGKGNLHCWFYWPMHVWRVFLLTR